MIRDKEIVLRLRLASSGNAFQSDPGRDQDSLIGTGGGLCCRGVHLYECEAALAGC